MRRFGMKMGLVASMEDEEQRRRAENPQPEEVLDNAENAETAQLEVEDSLGEGEEGMTKVEDASEVSDAMESLKASMESFAANGGMSRETAGVVMQYNAYLCHRAGIEAADIRMPSLESFGGSGTRMRGTTLALEGIKEQLKKVWDAIVAGLKKVWEWVKDFWNKYFGAAEKLAERAKKVEDAGDKLAGKTKKEAKFEDESLFKKLYIGGDVSGSEISKAIAALKTGYTFTISSIEGAKELPDDAGKLEAYEIKVDDFAKGLDAVSGDQYGTAGAGMKFYRSKEFPGGRCMLVRAPDGEKKGQEALEATGKVAVSNAAFNAKEPNAKPLTTMDSTDIMDIAKKIGDLARFMVDNRKKVDGIVKKIDTAVKAAEKIANKAVDDKDTENKDLWRAAQGAFRNVNNYMVKPVIIGQQFSISVGKSALDYCEKSIAQYEEKK